MVLQSGKGEGEESKRQPAGNSSAYDTTVDCRRSHPAELSYVPALFTAQLSLRLRDSPRRTIWTFIMNSIYDGQRLYCGRT